MSYSVGELAKLTGISVRTLHHYDSIGLLVARERTSAGYRRYTDAELERLRQIVKYRDLGFSLARIKEVLDDPAVNPGDQLQEQKNALRDQAERLQLTLRRVESMLEQERSDTSDNGGPVAVPGRREQLQKALPIASGGFVLGAATIFLWENSGLSRQVSFEWLGLGVAALTVLILARFASRRETPQIVFQTWNAAMWLGFAAGCSIVDSSLAEESAAASLVAGAVTAALGAAIVAASGGTRQSGSRRLAGEGLVGSRGKGPANLFTLSTAVVVFTAILGARIGGLMNAEMDVSSARMISTEAIAASFAEASLTTAMILLVSALAIRLYRSKHERLPISGV